MDSKIHNSKKTLWIHQSVTELGFRIQQSENQQFMQNLLPKHPIIWKIQLIQFWIHESVIHYRISISDNPEISITTMLLKKLNSYLYNANNTSTT